MALVYPVIDLIIAEDARTPITGDILFVGKQETFGRDLGYPPSVKLHTMDWSPHFGADIVCDLGFPIGDELKNRFNFIYDGGSLDNMFNPAQGIMNIADMLKPDGRMLCLACASAFSMPYTMFCPGWFYDYFEVNRFKSWKVYLASYHGENELLRGPWNFYDLSGEQINKNRPAPMPRPETPDWLCVSIATKGVYSTSNKQPIQYQYRPKDL